MMETDDIKGLPSGGFTETTREDADDKAGPAPRLPRSIGPESEVRGGPEAPPDDDKPDSSTGA